MSLPPPVSPTPPSTASSHQSCRPPPGYCTWWTLLRPHLGLSAGSDTAGSSLPETHFFPLGSKRPPTTRSWCDPVSGLQFSLLCCPLFSPASKWSGVAEPSPLPQICSVWPWPSPRPWFQRHTARWLPCFHLRLASPVCLFHPRVPGGIISGNIYWEQRKTDFPPTGVSHLGRGTIYLPSCSNPKSRHLLWFFPLLCTGRTHCGCWLILPVVYQECVCFLALALPSP